MLISHPHYFFVSLSMEPELLNNFISYLRNEKRYSELTIQAYGHDIEQFGYFLLHGSLPQDNQIQAQEYKFFDPKVVKANNIKQWVMALNSSDYKASSVNRRISSLRSYFRFLCKQQVVEDNPTLRISSLKREHRLPEFVEQTKMDSIVERIKEYQGDDHDQIRDNLIILLFFTLGMRLAELTSIHIEDFSNNFSELKVKGKGDKERLLPVLPMVIPYINRYIEARDIQIQENNNKNVKKIDNTCNSQKKILFLTNKAESISRGMVYRIVNKKLREVGVTSKSSPHVLRHTFATYMLNQGADLRSIQELLGHASLEATQIYTHNNISRLKEVYQTAHPRSKLKTNKED